MKIFKPIAVLTISLFLGIAQAHALEIAVIVNSSGPLIDAADRDITDIYLGDKRFEDGIKILPLLYPEGDVKEAFLKEAVKMTPKEYKLYWTKKVFQEGIPIPKAPATPLDIVNAVKSDKGGIGYLPKEMLKDLSGIKIIKTIKVAR